jgi:hypothetical protein
MGSYNTQALQRPTIPFLTTGWLLMWHHPLKQIKLFRELAGADK